MSITKLAEKYNKELQKTLFTFDIERYVKYAEQGVNWCIPTIADGKLKISIRYEPMENISVLQYRMVLYIEHITQVLTCVQTQTVVSYYLGTHIKRRNVRSLCMFAKMCTRKYIAEMLHKYQKYEYVKYVIN